MLYLPIYMNDFKQTERSNRLRHGGTDAVHCQLHVVFRVFRKRSIYKNIKELLFLFLHERRTLYG